MKCPIFQFPALLLRVLAALFMAGFCAAGQTPAYITNSPPEYYSEAALTEALRRKLTPVELKLIVNPLASTPEMDAWARQITTGADTDEAKARLLFNTLAYRASNAGKLKPAPIRTAREVFAAWNVPGESFYCKDYAFLYVALARAVGIKAYDVNVQEDAYGQPMQHNCAAIVLGGKMLLVDPTFAQFGAPHKQFTVLDDLETIGLQLSEFPGVERSQIACKLAPDIALTQLNLFEKLMGENRLNEAREILPKIKRLDTNAAVGDYADAKIALIEGKSKTAIGLLLNAIAIDPHQGPYYTPLAIAFAEEGRFSEARETLQKMLLYPITTEEAELPQKLIADTNEFAAWGSFLYGVGMMNRSDWDGAIKSYNKVIELKPDMGEAYANRGEAKTAKGDWDGAFADYNKAVKLNPKLSPNMAQGFKDLGRVHYNQHEFADAMTNFRKVCELGFPDDYVYFHFWIIRSRLGETVAATTELQAYLDTRKTGAPGDWPSKIGNFLTGQLTESELFKSAQSADKRDDTRQHCEAYFYAGSKRMINGENAVAAEYFEKCIATGMKDLPEYQSAVAELQFLKAKK